MIEYEIGRETLEVGNTTLTSEEFEYFLLKKKKNQTFQLIFS